MALTKVGKEGVTGISNSSDATAITIDSSERVGIGTSVNSLFNAVGGVAKLAVTGESSSTNILGNTDASIAIINTDQTANNTAGLHFARADTDDTPNYAGASIVAQFPDAQVTGQYPKGELAFLTSTTANAAPSEKMRIDAAGALSVGKVTPDDTTLGVHISKSGTTTGRVTFTGDNSSGDAGFYGTNTSGSGVFIVRPNGNVQNVNNSYGAISDLNLKENIQDASSQWDDVKSLKVRKYSLISEASDTPTQLGVIAQEVEDAGMSGLVHETWDIANPDVNIKHVKYSILYMKAVKALQEAMERIETLETKVQALEDA